MIKKRLRKKAMMKAGKHPATLWQALRGHKGSVQQLPNRRGFIKVTGKPGENQTVKLWDPNGRRTRKRVFLGKKTVTPIGGGPDVGVNRGETSHFYRRDGRLSAMTKTRRKLVETPAHISAGKGAHGGIIIPWSAKIREITKVKKWDPDGERIHTSKVVRGKPVGQK